MLRGRPTVKKSAGPGHPPNRVIFDHAAGITAPSITRFG
jgi:hypothetical protein